MPSISPQVQQALRALVAAYREEHERPPTAGEPVDLRAAVKAEVERRGWTAYRLAKETDLHQLTVRDFLAGTADSRSEAVSAMMTALGLSVQRGR